MILALQGSMAAGKTSDIEYLRKHTSDLVISEEDHHEVVQKVKERHLDKNRYEDYLEIQKMYLQDEIERFDRLKDYPCVVMDYGAEEIEFYTLCYPGSIGEDWDIEGPLHHQLEQIRKCMPDRILFLDASVQTLCVHKEADSTRSRTFFDHYVEHLLPMKRQWFLNRDNVDFLNVDGLSAYCGLWERCCGED